MDKQSRLLDPEYISIRIQELKPIRRNELKFRLENSNRTYSNSIYVIFYSQTKDFHYKAHTLRISDHPQLHCVHSEFIVKPDEDLTKKKKEQFMRALELASKKALEKEMYCNLNKITGA